MDTKKDKKMSKVIGITFAISLILGLSIGFIIGAGTIIYVGKDLAEDFIEDNEFKIMPALILDMNKTTISDYTKDLINTSNMINTSEIRDEIIRRFKNG